MGGRGEGSGSPLYRGLSSFPGSTRALRLNEKVAA